MPKFKYNPGDNIGPYKIKMVERIKKKDNKRWICKFICPYCGNFFNTVLDNVVRGDTRSCGCYAHEIAQKNGYKKGLNLLNKRFGKIVVIEKTEQRKNTYIVWKCQCDCGNITYVTTGNLRNGSTTSCGHCTISKGEDKIKNILDKMEINYIQEYKFKDCTNPETGYQLRFDFYLSDYNICIEYDGEQHFLYNKRGRFDKKYYENNIKRDNIKNQYCKNNNINLIRIPYTDYEKLNLIYLKGLIDDVVQRQSPDSSYAIS